MRSQKSRAEDKNLDAVEFSMKWKKRLGNKRGDRVEEQHYQGVL